MGHYAKVLNGTVVNVIVAEPDFFATFVDSAPGDWIQTSYNTQAGQHALGGTPLRGNYAGVGYIYDGQHDVFYPPKPYDSWSLNTTNWTWESPVPHPADGKLYKWVEHDKNWAEVILPTEPVTDTPPTGV
jgi:hypothetical protein